MRNWDLVDLDVRPQAPRIIASHDDARAIVLHLEAGEELQEHEVHERAWLLVLTGEVEVESQDGTRATGSCGLLSEFTPRERHHVRARSDTRLLLFLTPWPGSGHPGAMSLVDKRNVRERARERASDDAA